MKKGFLGKTESRAWRKDWWICGWCQGNASGRVSEGLGRWASLVFCFRTKLVLQLGSWCSSQSRFSSPGPVWTRTLIFFTEPFICRRSGSGTRARSPFPCTHKTSSPRLQEQLMNSWAPDSAPVKYYCIVHHNDGNNLVTTVHEARPCTKPAASHTPLLSLVNTKKAFHSPSRGSHCWKGRWSLSSWHSGLWPWILRAVILQGSSFPSPRGFNAYGK